MPIHNKFWDRMANRYSKSPVGNEEVYQKKLQITHEYLRPDMEVLEFGCGTGSTAITHAPHVKHIQAIDFSVNMIEIAEGKADAAGIKNVTFQKADIEELSVTNNTFDLIMGHSILHLLDNKEAVISRVHAMLKPGGVFVSSTTCMGAKFHIMKIILPVGQFFGLLPLVRFFTVQQLVDSITNAGFEIDHQWLPDGSDAVFIVAKKIA